MDDIMGAPPMGGGAHQLQGSIDQLNMSIRTFTDSVNGLGSRLVQGAAGSFGQAMDIGQRFASGVAGSIASPVVAMAPQNVVMPVAPGAQQFNAPGLLSNFMAANFPAAPFGITGPPTATLGGSSIPQGEWTRYNRELLSHRTSNFIDSATAHFSRNAFTYGGLAVDAALFATGASAGPLAIPLIAASMLGDSATGGYGVLPGGRDAAFRMGQRDIAQFMHDKNLRLGKNAMSSTDISRFSSGMMETIAAESDRYRDRGWGLLPSSPQVTMDELSRGLLSSGVFKNLISEERGRGGRQVSGDLKEIQSRLKDDIQAIIEIKKTLGTTIEESAQQIQQIRAYSKPGTSSTSAVTQFTGQMNMVAQTLGISQEAAYTYTQQMGAMYQQTGLNTQMWWSQLGVSSARAASNVMKERPELYDDPVKAEAAMRQALLAGAQSFREGGPDGRGFDKDEFFSAGLDLEKLKKGEVVFNAGQARKALPKLAKDKDFRKQQSDEINKIVGDNPALRQKIKEKSEKFMGDTSLPDEDTFFDVQRHIAAVEAKAEKDPKLKARLDKWTPEERAIAIGASYAKQLVKAGKIDKATSILATPQFISMVNPEWWDKNRKQKAEEDTQGVLIHQGQLRTNASWWARLWGEDAITEEIAGETRAAEHRQYTPADVTGLYARGAETWAKKWSSTAPEAYLKATERTKAAAEGLIESQRKLGVIDPLRAAGSALSVAQSRINKRGGAIGLDITPLQEITTPEEFEAIRRSAGGWKQEWDDQPGALNFKTGAQRYAAAYGELQRNKEYTEVTGGKFTLQDAIMVTSGKATVAQVVDYYKNKGSKAAGQYYADKRKTVDPIFSAWGREGITPERMIRGVEAAEPLERVVARVGEEKFIEASLASGVQLAGGEDPGAALRRRLRKDASVKPLFEEAETGAYLYQKAKTLGQILSPGGAWSDYSEDIRQGAAKAVDTGKIAPDALGSIKAEFDKASQDVKANGLLPSKEATSLLDSLRSQQFKIPADLGNAQGGMSQDALLNLLKNVIQQMNQRSATEGGISPSDPGKGAAAAEKTQTMVQDYTDKVRSAYANLTSAMGSMVRRLEDMNVAGPGFAGAPGMGGNVV